MSRLAAFDERLIRLCEECPSHMPNLFRKELHRCEFSPLLANPLLLNFIMRIMAPDVAQVRIYPNYSCRPKTRSKLHAVT